MAKWTIFCSILIFLIAISIPYSHAKPKKRHASNSTGTFVIMSFNVWLGGSVVTDGVRKAAYHILAANADIVALQESTNAIDEIRDALNEQVLADPSQKGRLWQSCKHPNDYHTEPHIITRLPIPESYNRPFRSSGCKIQISEYPLSYVKIWNVHLSSESYGPYAVCLKDVKYQEAQSMISSQEKQGNRYEEVKTLFKHHPFSSQIKLSTTSIILAGDFNSPSHLDWTEETKKQHCNVSFEWPVSKFLIDHGFQDSYREANPNPITHPGTTWSTVRKKDFLTGSDAPEPQDRIDFIYYRSRSLKVLSSRHYHGDKPIEIEPNYKENDWPSDHAAVITEFELVEDN